MNTMFMWVQTAALVWILKSTKDCFLVPMNKIKAGPRERFKIAEDFIHSAV